VPNPSHPVARVYAAALTEIGRETKSLGTIHDDLEAVRRLYDTDRWFRQFFTSPRIDRQVKWAAVRKAFEGQVGRPVLGLLKVLIQKGREPTLDNVADQFDKMKDLAENRMHAYLTVARPLADELRKTLQGRLERASGLAVVVHERVDPAVLGGASIRVGDRVIDRTLRTRLGALRKVLLSS
jgi:F-type H+-transporting ATPase subunit delta